MVGSTELQCTGCGKMYLVSANTLVNHDQQDQRPAQGFYITYESSDARILPFLGKGPAPFETELEATQALLTYLESLQTGISRAIQETKDELKTLEPRRGCNSMWHRENHSYHSVCPSCGKS